MSTEADPVRIRPARPYDAAALLELKRQLDQETAFMMYEPGERDFVMLQHKFEIENADGTTETRTSTLCEYGSPEPGGYSAMAKLVGVPCGVAVKQVLDGTISDKSRPGRSREAVIPEKLRKSRTLLTITLIFLPHKWPVKWPFPIAYCQKFLEL